RSAGGRVERELLAPRRSRAPRSKSRIPDRGSVSDEELAGVEPQPLARVDGGDAAPLPVRGTRVAASVAGDERSAAALVPDELGRAATEYAPSPAGLRSSSRRRRAARSTQPRAR